MLNRSGPKTDPCGTPVVIFPCAINIIYSSSLFSFCYVAVYKFSGHFYQNHMLLTLQLVICD